MTNPLPRPVRPTGPSSSPRKPKGNDLPPVVKAVVGVAAGAAAVIQLAGTLFVGGLFIAFFLFLLEVFKYF